MSATQVRVLSRRLVRPSPRSDDGDHRRIIHLTPWDLKMLSVDYIQKGILFHKPIPTKDGTDSIISDLLSSFSRSLDLFFPLAGRLATVNHDTSPPSISILLECNDEGAEFIHASAPDTTVSDILTRGYIPSIINHFFPLNGAVNHDGHDSPLLAVQVTELADGLFLACSLNHAVADGTTFWHFLNSWSDIARSLVPRRPSLDRWFLDSCPPPIRLPYGDHREFIRRPVYTPVKEHFFHFPARSIASLKARANAEMGGTRRISSLQSLLAHVWRAVIRASGLDPEGETNYMLMVGFRARLNPPLPDTYLGNAATAIATRATAGELAGKGLGWAALQLNEQVAAQSEGAAQTMVENWAKSPSFMYIGGRVGFLGTGSSPRFNVYGNDFGWGRPVAVRSGPGNKTDGKVTVYPGTEDGSMALEVCLLARTLQVMLEPGGRGVHGSCREPMIC